MDLENGVLENKIFINPSFSGKLTLTGLTNVVFLNGKLGVIDLSEGATLNGVVFRGNQIAWLNFGGANLNRVILDGNLKHQPKYYGAKEEQLAAPIDINLRDSTLRNSVFVNNVMLVHANKNTLIYKTSFTRNNMIGSLMQGAKVEKSDFTDNDARDSDLRFSKATDVKIVKNQISGAKYPKGGKKARVSIQGNWANNPVKAWERIKTQKAS
jgi:uncharacterized protein YjbI with pentapeptide repeats